MPYTPLILEGVNVATSYSLNSLTSLEVPRPPFLPGTQVITADGSMFVFCQIGTTGATIVVGDVVVITQDNTWVCVGGTDTTIKTFIGRPLGVAAVGSVVSTATVVNYIWVQRAGFAANVNVVTGSTANTLVRSSASSGRITTTAAVGVSAQITGLVANATAAANLANCFLNFPAASTAD